LAGCDPPQRVHDVGCSFHDDSLPVRGKRDDGQRPPDEVLLRVHLPVICHEHVEGAFQTAEEFTVTDLGPFLKRDRADREGGVL
jgi:hypothetical protein